MHRGLHLAHGSWDPWKDSEQKRSMPDVNFRSRAGGGRWSMAVDQIQGHGKGAPDTCPGSTQCGVDPGRDK